MSKEDGIREEAPILEQNGYKHIVCVDKELDAYYMLNNLVCWRITKMIEDEKNIKRTYKCTAKGRLKAIRELAQWERSKDE